MKKLITLLLALPFAIFAQNNVGVGTNTPDASAVLDIESTNKGLLIPRVSLTDVFATLPVSNPATGLLVYNINSLMGGGDVGFYFYNGSIWESLGKSIEVDPKIDLSDPKAVPFWDGTKLVDGLIYNHSYGVSIGNSAVAEAKLDVTQTATSPLGAIVGRGPYDANGVVGAQFYDGDLDMDISDLSGAEVGLLGTSTGTSTQDNIGVLGYSNDRAGRFVHDNGKSDVTLAGTDKAFEVKNAKPHATTVVDITQNSASGYYRGTNVWQSFKPTKTGLLTGVEVYMRTPLSVPVTFTIKIYKGTGTGGTLIGTTQLSVSNTSSSYKLFTLSGIKVKTNTIYTFELSQTVSTNIWLRAQGSNAYVYGISSYDDPSTSTIVDLRFKTWVSEASPLESSIIVVNTNVGIGNTTPTSKLDVAGDIKFTKALKPNGNAGITNQVLISKGSTLPPVWSSVTSIGGGKWKTSGNGNTYITSGNVGIGTSSPSKASLEITSYKSNSHTNYGYLGLTGAGTFTGTQTHQLAIYASKNIAANGFIAHSDMRIKNIKGLSNASADLSTLLKIEITDYTMIDVVEKGDKAYKKVIAQQVAQVYPQAVTTTITEVVPDIYKKAEIENNWILLETNLKVGERVKIITDKEAEIYTVTEVKNSKFKVDNLALNTNDLALFVYGREVDDFHAVDYEAIAMLNVSATQAQQRLIEAQQEEINNLKTQLQESSTATLQLKTEVEEIKAMLGLQASVAH